MTLSELRRRNRDAHITSAVPYPKLGGILLISFKGDNTLRGFFKRTL